LQCEELACGEYYLYCEVDWVKGAFVTTFTATCYGTSKVDFEDVSHVHTRGEYVRMVIQGMVALEKTGKDYKIQKFPCEKSPNCILHEIFLDSNFQCMLLENNDASVMKYALTV